MTISIVGGIIQLFVILLPAVLLFLAKRNSTEVVLSEKNKDTDEHIANHDAAAITVDVNTMLRQLQDKDDLASK